MERAKTSGEREAETENGRGEQSNTNADSKVRDGSSRKTMKYFTVADVLERLKNEDVKEEDIKTIDDKYGLRVQIGPLTFLINDDPLKCLACVDERQHCGHAVTPDNTAGKSDSSSVSASDLEDEVDSEDSEDEVDKETSEKTKSVQHKTKTVSPSSVLNSEIDEREIKDKEDELDTANISNAGTTGPADSSAPSEPDILATPPTTGASADPGPCQDREECIERGTRHPQQDTETAELVVTTESTQILEMATAFDSGMRVASALENTEEDIIIIGEIPGTKVLRTVDSDHSTKIDNLKSSSYRVRIPGILDDVDEISEANLLPDLNEIITPNLEELQEHEISISGLENDIILMDGFEALMSGFPSDEHGDVDNSDLKPLESNASNPAFPIWYKDPAAFKQDRSSSPEPEISFEYERRKPLNRIGDCERNTESVVSEYILDRSNAPTPVKKPRMEYLQFNEYGQVNSRGDVDMRVTRQTATFSSTMTDEAGSRSWFQSTAFEQTESHQQNSNNAWWNQMPVFPPPTFPPSAFPTQQLMQNSMFPCSGTPNILQQNFVFNPTMTIVAPEQRIRMISQTFLPVVTTFPALTQNQSSQLPSFTSPFGLNSSQPRP